MRLGRAKVTRLPLLAVAIAVVGCSAQSRETSVEPKRQKVDALEVQGMQLMHPKAAKLMEEGEAALRANDLERAVEDFRQAEVEAPAAAIVPRRQCQALTALGRRDEAIRACERAVGKLGSGMDFRALVGALVSAPPTPTEMAKAMAMAARAREVMPTEPWGYAAQCDIARRLGDTEMFNTCVQDLQRVAPDHYETRRVLAVAESLRHPWRLALGWGVILLGSLLTLLSPLRRIRRSAVGRGAVATACIVAVWASIASPAQAAEQPETEPSRDVGSMSQWPVNDNDPVASLPTPKQRDSNPIEYGYHLMDLGDRAEKATERGDHAQAVKYWLAMAKAVPDRHIAFAKACESYEAMGEIDKAAYACHAATVRPGAQVKDFSRYFKLALQKKALDPEEVQDLEAVLTHLRGVAGATVVANALNCELGIRMSDVKRLEECAGPLAETAPNDPLAIFSQWYLAVFKKNTAEAERLVGVARASGMSPVDLQRMEKVTWESTPFWRRALKRWPIVASGVLLVAAGIAFALYAMRRRIAVPQPQG
jgi:tetratricopeptide (TPR) repeat protein